MTLRIKCFTDRKNFRIKDRQTKGITFYLQQNIGQGVQI